MTAAQRRETPPVDHPVVLCEDNALYLVSTNPPPLCALTPLPH